LQLVYPAILTNIVFGQCETPSIYFIWVSRLRIMPGIQVINNLLQTPGILFRLKSNIKKQEKFIGKYLLPRLTSARKKNDGSLDENDFKKITHYYGLAVPAILGEAICQLRGKEMTTRERMALTFQGAMTGLFDDFFDKKDMDEEMVRTLMEKSLALKGANAAEKLFLEFYRVAIEYAHEPHLMVKYLSRVYDAQIESKKQSKPGLSKDEMHRITIDKGGVSVLFYRAVLDHPFLEGEEEALYKTGGLMQLGNDIFDVYKDLNKGIETLMTTTKSVANVKEVFNKARAESFESIRLLGYSPKNIDRFLQYVSMALCSRCYVFFDQLEKKELSSANVFSPTLYSRADLICDMEKASNKWKTILIYLKKGIE
jgi:hypothetical protein